MQWEICYTLDDVRHKLDALRDVEIETLVICCGTNNTDKQTGTDVGNEIVKLIHEIKLDHPLTKIVLSEATPRKYNRDNEIRRCNETLHQHLSQTPNVFIANQSSLRDATWSLYEDDKHILREHINVYAGNIKSAMRDARTKREQTSGAPTRNQTTPAPYISHSRYAPHNNTNIVSSGAKPLMSCLSAPPNPNSTNFHPHPPAHRQHLASSNQPPAMAHNATSRPTRNSNSNIGDRLLHLSQSPPDDQNKVNKLRETLTDKFNDIIQCLQVW